MIQYMGSGGVTNRTVVIVHGKKGDLPTKRAKPNSRYDLYINNIKHQSRWFDVNGKVVRNRDYIHQDPHNNHFFPHDHDWIWIKNNPIRGKNLLVPDYDSYY